MFHTWKLPTAPPTRQHLASAVFFESLKTADDLEKLALAKYRYFVGELWERYGEEAWMGPWKEVYERKPGTKRDIVAKLQGIKDRDASISVPMILDVVENAEAARHALSVTYDNEFEFQNSSFCMKHPILRDAFVGTKKVHAYEAKTLSTR